MYEIYFLSPFDQLVGKIMGWGFIVIFFLILASATIHFLEYIRKNWK